MISLPSKQPTLCMTVPVRKKRRISYVSSQSSGSTASAGPVPIFTPKELRTHCTESNYWLTSATTTATRCHRRRRRCRQTSRSTTTAAAAVAKENRGVSSKQRRMVLRRHATITTTSRSDDEGGGSLWTATAGTIMDNDGKGGMVRRRPRVLRSGVTTTMSWANLTPLLLQRQPTKKTVVW